MTNKGTFIMKKSITALGIIGTILFFFSMVGLSQAGPKHDENPVPGPYTGSENNLGGAGAGAGADADADAGADMTNLTNPSKQTERKQTEGPTQPPPTSIENFNSIPSAVNQNVNSARPSIKSLSSGKGNPVLERRKLQRE